MAEENSYPAVRFMLRFSKLFALILGLAVAAGELWAAAAARLGWWRTAAGVVGGLLVFFFVRFFRRTGAQKVPRMSSNLLT